MDKKSFPFLLFFISIFSFGQNIHFQAIGVENGISQPTVTSIYQDEFGIIWIGTKDGLNRYNGTDFQIFRPIRTIRTVCTIITSAQFVVIRTAISISAANMLWLNTI